MKSVLSLLLIKNRYVALYGSFAFKHILSVYGSWFFRSSNGII